MRGMRRVHYRYSLGKRIRTYPTKAWLATRSTHRAIATMLVLVLLAGFLVNLQATLNETKPVDYTVAGQNYEICNEQSQYLTSPWTYNGLASGSQNYDVSQYEALPGYGTTLPPLPSYIQSEDPSTEAAVIFAPGSTTSLPQYDYPNTPLVYYFEGGAYGYLGLSSVTGDEFIGGSATGFPEPQFNDANGAGGIDAQNGTFDFSGGHSTLTATGNVNDTSVSVASTIPGYINWLTFSDGSTYQITNNLGNTVDISPGLSSTEASGQTVWGSQMQPIASVTSAASQGGTTVSISASAIPLMQYGKVRIGDDSYELTGVTGSETAGYTLSVAGLDMNVAANTPVYYDGLAGDVTVKYLDIANDSHNTTGTIYTGAGWTIENNNIHDGYKNSGGTPTPGLGVAIYGGDNGLIEYNCLSKMGDYGANVFGTNNKFDYNEVYESNYLPDPGCGCSGGGKWWGTLNADIVDNAFINDSPGGSFPVWLDNGNSGTLIQGNYFDKSAASSISSETGFDLEVTGNLFQDDDWDTGHGCGNTNCVGDVGINSSGGFNVQGSRFNNQLIISNNTFLDDWAGVGIWQAGGRNCENSGEGWPADAPYCSGGFPNNAETPAGGHYYFSHVTDSNRGGTEGLVQPVSNGDSTVLVDGSEATNDQIGFSDPVSTTTTDTTDVTTFNGSGTISASNSASFPTSGQLRVGTTGAWNDGNGSWTGAILAYTGNTGTSFTGVSFVRGTGTLSGPIQQVQPYTVTGETCYSNDCKVSVSPSISGNYAAGQQVSNAGTCQLFATSAALPSGPLAPDGSSYWDGCQWEARNISVTGNNFILQPSRMNASTALSGGAVSCTAANYCGENFMADQYNSGEAPFNSELGSNMMMSSSSFTGCPGWDTGCTTNPLANLNAGANPPGVTPGNGAVPGNNVWTSNTYTGPWSWNTDIYGNCAGGGVFMPSDVSTGNSLNAGACSVDYPNWQKDWQQDQGSTDDPLAVSMSNLTANQQIHGSAQQVGAYEDTESPNTISSTLKVNGSQVGGNLSSGPFNFSLNTLGYHDGSYTLQITGTDSGGNTNSDSVPVYVSNGDLNGDGHVNLSDLAVMAAHWGQTDSNYGDGNITGQSTINISDLAVMAANWGWVQ